jgi:hypothetical protein
VTREAGVEQFHTPTVLYVIGRTYSIESLVAREFRRAISRDRLHGHVSPMPYITALFRRGTDGDAGRNFYGIGWIK